MTVAELITKLQELNQPDLKVRIEVYTPGVEPEEIESEETLVINDIIENDGKVQLWAHSEDEEDGEAEEGDEA